MNDHVALIKKLLRLARDKAASTAEASQALNRAMELIQRHNVDLAALELDEADEQFVMEKLKIGWRISLAKHHALRILINCFNIRAVICKPFVAVMGTESDVAIATYVWEFILGACSRATADWAKAEKKARRKTTGQKRLAFQQGWFYGLRAGLTKSDPTPLEDSSTALILANRKKRLEAFADAQFPNTVDAPQRKNPRQNKTAIYQGFLAGKETTILKPLDGPGATQLLLG